MDICHEYFHSNVVRLDYGPIVNSYFSSSTTTVVTVAQYLRYCTVVFS